MREDVMLMIVGSALALVGGVLLARTQVKRQWRLSRWVWGIVAILCFYVPSFTSQFGTWVSYPIYVIGGVAAVAFCELTRQMLEAGQYRGVPHHYRKEDES